MIRISIVEDEVNILNTIKQILSEYCRDTEISGIATDVESAVNMLQNTGTDLALLDISIPGGNIFNVLKQIGKVDFKIIFITAHEEYAIQAIKFSAFDYLLKPVDPLELIKSINTASQVIKKENTDIQISALIDNLDSDNQRIKTIVLKTSENIYPVSIKEIIRCESDSSYTTFYLNAGKKILVSKTLKEYADILSSSGFFRVHQSHLVNLEQIDSFDKRDGGYLVMKDKSKVPVASRKKEVLLKMFDKMGRI